MDFTFSEDQLLFQESVREFLVNEVTPEALRALWEQDSGRSDALWGQLAELGLCGMTIAEEHGGLGMNELDFVLLAQECGYVALPEPLVHNALVSAPLLAALPALGSEWLPKMAAGEARVQVATGDDALVEDAHIAQLLVLERGGALYAVDPANCELTANESVDPSRKLFTVSWETSAASKLADGEQAANLIAAIENRGALSLAAQSLGLSQRMIDLAVTYTTDRQQFGKPIGSFQAVKHMMANIAYKLEYAKAPVHRAAYELAQRPVDAGSARDSRVDALVSHAKIVACEAAQIAAKNTIQAHGAMGYTWEVDLHIYMKRAWAYNNSWGDAAEHKQRVAHFVLAEGAAIGAGNTFA